jgi:hypothetical protein
VVGGGRVLFSESPPLVRGNGGQTPFFERNFFRCFCGAGVVFGGVPLWWCSGWLVSADLTGAGLAGKFEKLLRSDPECLVWVVPVSVCCLRTQ